MKNRYLKNLNVGEKVKNTLTYISAFSSILENKIVQRSAERLFQHYHLVWIYSGDQILIRCQRPREKTHGDKIFDSALEIKAKDYNSPFEFKSGTISEIFNSDKKPEEEICSNFTDLISGFVPEFKPYANLIKKSIGDLTSTKDKGQMTNLVSDLLTDINKIGNKSSIAKEYNINDFIKNNDKCDKSVSVTDRNPSRRIPGSSEKDIGVEETLKLVSDIYLKNYDSDLSDKKENPEVTITNESDDEEYEVSSVNDVDSDINNNRGKEEIVNDYFDSEDNKKEEETGNNGKTNNEKKEEVMINNLEDLTKLFIDLNTEGKDFKINEKSFKDDLTKFRSFFDIDLNIDTSELLDIINKSKGNRIEKMCDIKNLLERCNKNSHSSRDSGDTNVNKEDKKETGNNIKVIELNTVDDVANLFKEFLGNCKTDNQSNDNKGIVNTILDYVEKYFKGDNLYNKLGSFQDLLANGLTNEINNNDKNFLNEFLKTNISSMSIKKDKKKKSNKEKAKQLRIKAGMIDPVPFRKLNLPAELITELEHYQEDLKVLGFEYFYIGHTDKLIDNFSKVYQNCERKYKTSTDKFTVRINIENSGRSYPDLYVLVEMDKNGKSYMNVIPY